MLYAMPRTPNVGKAFIQQCHDSIQGLPQVTIERRSALLNTLTTDSDVFEAAALLDGDGWKLLSSKNTLPKALRIPEGCVLPDSTEVLGNGQAVKSEVYAKVMEGLHGQTHYINPSAFNEYSSSKSTNVTDFAPSYSNNGDPMQWFRIPWGQVTLHSSLSDESVDFPVYPEEMSDSAKANYTTMPDLLYQYEPWQLYNSSGPRQQTYTFDFHRDMWTGDHRDGQANKLIRFCEANCYPEYRGSAVYSSIVTLYIAGKPLIRGVMVDVNTSWDGPLGLDGYYLHCKLELNIIEVSAKPLDYHTVMMCAEILDTYLDIVDFVKLLTIHQICMIDS